MSQYYYLCASLPMLRFEGAPFTNTQGFLQMCQGVMEEGDYEDLARSKIFAAVFDPGGPALYRQYQKMEFEARNELTKLRAKKKNVDVEAYLRKDFINPLWASALHEAVEEPSPLKQELLLARIYWKILDELGVGESFNLGFLVVYHLKLQILERKFSFKTDTGKVKLEAILSGVAHHEQ